jgi:pimeloyl-ACP methyl ester carboxylesterase
MADTVGLAAYGLDDESTRRWLEHNAGRKIRRLAQRANHLASSTSIIDDLVAEAPFPPDALAALRCPVTAVYGERSDIVERGRDLERHIPGARLHLVPGVEHGVLHEDASAVRVHAVDWVGRAVAARAAA